MRGAHRDRFKPYLFANQPLDELLASMAPPGGELAEAVAKLRAGEPAEAEVVLGATLLTRPESFGPWHNLLLAGIRQARGNTKGAITALHRAAETGESRIKLWAWHNLRALGELPDDATGTPVRGVLAEVEAGTGVDTLAAYQDGSARYLLAKGAKLVWEQPDDRLRADIDAVLAAAQAIAADVPLGEREGEPPAATVRLSLLTCAGIRVAEDPLADVVGDHSPRAPLFGAVTTLLEKILVIAKW